MIHIYVKETIVTKRIYSASNTDSNAYLTDTVNRTICNILNTDYTKTDNGVVIPKDSSACIEIPSSNTNYGKHHENANYEVRVIK